MFRYVNSGIFSILRDLTRKRLFMKKVILPFFLKASLVSVLIVPSVFASDLVINEAALDLRLTTNPLNFGTLGRDVYGHQNGFSTSTYGLGSDFSSENIGLSYDSSIEGKNDYSEPGGFSPVANYSLGLDLWDNNNFWNSPSSGSYYSPTPLLSFQSYLEEKDNEALQAMHDRIRIQDDFDSHYNECRINKVEGDCERLRKNIDGVTYFRNSLKAESDAKVNNCIDIESKKCANKAFDEIKEKTADLDVLNLGILEDHLNVNYSFEDDIDLVAGNSGQVKKEFNSILGGMCPALALDQSTPNNDLFLQNLWLGVQSGGDPSNKANCEKKYNSNGAGEGSGAQSVISGDYCECVAANRRRTGEGENNSAPEYDGIQCLEVQNATDSFIGSQMADLLQKGMATRMKGIYTILNDPKALEDSPAAACMPNGVEAMRERSGCSQESTSKVAKLFLKMLKQDISNQAKAEAASAGVAVDARYGEQMSSDFVQHVTARAAHDPGNVVNGVVMGDVANAAVAAGIQAHNMPMGEEAAFAQIIQSHEKDSVLQTVSLVAPHLLTDKFQGYSSITDPAERLKLMQEFDVEENFYKVLNSSSDLVNVFTFEKKDMAVINKMTELAGDYDRQGFKEYFDNMPASDKRVLYKMQAFRHLTHPHDAENGAGFNGSAESAFNISEYFAHESRLMMNDFNRANPGSVLNGRISAEVLNEVVKAENMGSRRALEKACDEVVATFKNICQVLDEGKPKIAKSDLDLNRGSIQAKDNAAKLGKSFGVTNQTEKYKQFLCYNHFAHQEGAAAYDKMLSMLNPSEACEYEADKNFAADNMTLLNAFAAQTQSNETERLHRPDHTAFMDKCMRETQSEDPSVATAECEDKWKAEGQRYLNDYSITWLEDCKRRKESIAERFNGSCENRWETEVKERVLADWNQATAASKQRVADGNTNSAFNGMIGSSLGTSATPTSTNDRNSRPTISDIFERAGVTNGSSAHLENGIDRINKQDQDQLTASNNIQKAVNSDLSANPIEIEKKSGLQAMEDAQSQIQSVINNVNPNLGSNFASQLATINGEASASDVKRKAQATLNDTESLIREKSDELEAAEGVAEASGAKAEEDPRVQELLAELKQLQGQQSELEELLDNEREQRQIAESLNNSGVTQRTAQINSGSNTSTRSATNFGGGSAKSADPGRTAQTGGASGGGARVSAAPSTGGGPVNNGNYNDSGNRDYGPGGSAYIPNKVLRLSSSNGGEVEFIRQNIGEAAWSDDRIRRYITAGGKSAGSVVIKTEEGAFQYTLVDGELKKIPVQIDEANGKVTTLDGSLIEGDGARLPASVIDDEVTSDGATDDDARQQTFKKDLDGLFDQQ
jgi:hypothetical protein